MVSSMENKKTNRKSKSGSSSDRPKMRHIKGTMVGTKDAQGHRVVDEEEGSDPDMEVSDDRPVVTASLPGGTKDVEEVEVTSSMSEDTEANLKLARQAVVLSRKTGAPVGTFKIDEPSKKRGGFQAIETIDADDIFPDLKGMKDEEILIHKIKKTAKKKENCFVKKDIPTIKAVCKAVSDILEKEPRCLDIPEPVHVFGDLHGHLSDLMWFSDNFWPRGPAHTTSHFLFLGDYVDRVKWGLHVALYLFCMKIMGSSKFFLLRGNHEERNLQKGYTFHKECLKFFDKKDGEEVWECVNQVFDRLPLCAIIADRIYCAHGGIPSGEVTKEQLLQIPCPLSEPENQSSLAWEILWNDPADDTYFARRQKTMSLAKKQDLVTKNINPEHFLPNTDRKTGFFFSSAATKAFLGRVIQASGKPALQAVIRAHEEATPGFDFKHGGGVITIFSASEYQGGRNNAALILVNHGVIRPIQVDVE